MSLDLAAILQYAVNSRASDIILTVGIPPQFKIHGEYQFGGFAEVTAGESRRLMYSMMNERQQKVFEETKEMDFAYAIKGLGRFRVNVFQQQGVVGGVMRLIPSKVRPLTQLGLPDTLLEFASAPRGMVLVTGATGSGKSTTLAAMIDYINQNKRKHIVTIEDPVEFIHPHKQSIVHQRDVGTDTISFEAALRGALRQAPDVILVGEMRDYETIRAAITAAETGHLVMGTLHTNGAAESIDRIIDVFPQEQQEQIRTQLANNLVGVVTQQLVPLLSGEGRAIAYEIMVAVSAVRALIREGKTFQIASIMQTGASQGMVTMDTCLASLYQRRLIAYDVGLARAVDSKEYARLANQSDSLLSINNNANKPPPAPMPTGFGRR